MDILTRSEELLLLSVWRLQGELTVRQNAKFDAEIEADGQAKFNGGFEAFAPSSINSNLYVEGSAQIVNGATIDGITTLNDVSINGSANLNGPTSLSGLLNVHSDANLNRHATVGQTLTVTGNTTLTSRLNANAEVNVSGTLTALSRAVLNDGADVNGQLQVNGGAHTTGNLTVDGLTQFNSNITAQNSATVLQDMVVGRNAHVSGNLNVVTDATVSGDLTVTGDLILQNGLPGTSYDGTFTVPGQTTEWHAVVVTNEVAENGRPMEFQCWHSEDVTVGGGSTLTARRCFITAKAWLGYYAGGVKYVDLEVLQESAHYVGNIGVSNEGPHLYIWLRGGTTFNYRSDQNLRVDLVTGPGGGGFEDLFAHGSPILAANDFD
ncbi:MAG: hypothetical protein AAF570_26695, partial [Bacteroidota bacterium]